MGRDPEEFRSHQGQKLSVAGQNAGELLVASQKVDPPLCHCAGPGATHAADRRANAAAGILRAVRPARLRPGRRPGNGQGLQATGALGLRRQRGAHL